MEEAEKFYGSLICELDVIRMKEFRELVDKDKSDFFETANVEAVEPFEH